MGISIYVLISRSMGVKVQDNDSLTYRGRRLVQSVSRGFAKNLR